MEFYDLKRELEEKWGLTENGLDELRDTVILTFERDAKTNNIISKHKGRFVFRDKNHEDRIFEGETWICSLTLKSSYYFAKGVRRLDASFLLELKREQMEDMAEVIWKEHRGKVEPILEEKYKEVTKRAISEKVAEACEEKDREIGELYTRIVDLEGRDAENRQIIASLEERARVAGNRPREPWSGIAAEMEPLHPEKMTVERIGPDEIYSEAFNRTRYFVHISSDYRVLVVRPHDSGDVVCMDNRIVLNGLSMVSPFSGHAPLLSEYSPRYGGIQVYLR